MGFLNFIPHNDPNNGRVQGIIQMDVLLCRGVESALWPLAVGSKSNHRQHPSPLSLSSLLLLTLWFNYIYLS